MLSAPTWLNLKAQPHCILIFSYDITSIQTMSRWESKCVLWLQWASFFPHPRSVAFSQKVRFRQELRLSHVLLYQRISKMFMCLFGMSTLHLLNLFDRLSKVFDMGEEEHYIILRRVQESKVRLFQVWVTGCFQRRQTVNVKNPKVCCNVGTANNIFFHI